MQASSERTLIRIGSVLPFLVFLLPINAENQPLRCTAQVPRTPIVRAEGLTELVGDIVIRCTGGTPTAAGSRVPQTDITIYFNNTQTERTSFPDRGNEALLLIDEPHSPTNPNVPLLVCGAAATNDDGAGRCSINGSGTGVGVYDGSPGRPNVFQGFYYSSTAIQFRGIPIDPPGAGQRTLRITNLRVDGRFHLGGAITAFIAIGDPSVLFLPYTYQTQTVRLLNRESWFRFPRSGH